MPTRIEYSSIFNTVLPSAYFKKISLLPSTLADTRTAVHFDKNIEYDFELNQLGKKVLGKKTLAFQDTGPQGQYLMVNAEVVLKDHMRRGNRLSWLDDKKLLKNLRLRVILSSDAEITKKFQEGRFSQDFIIRAKQTAKVQEQIIDLKKRSAFSKKETKMEMIGGKKVYCVYYTFSFKLTRYNPDHLAIFAHTFYDLNAHVRTMSAPTDSKRRFLQSPSTAASIIDNGSTNTKGRVFLLPNGKVWAGPVHHRKETGYMAGSSHSDSPHSTLTAKKVTNQVVRDYRLLDNLRAAKTLLVPFNKRSPREPKNKTSEALKIDRKPAYISEPIYSFDRQNHLGFVFHMNFHKIIKEHSQFGKFIDLTDEETKQDVYSKSRITNFKVFRNRVLSGLTPDQTIDAGYEEKIDLITEGGEKSSGKFKTKKITRPVQPNEETSGKIIVGASREVDLQFSQTAGIRSFSVSDYDMANKTDGFYSYSVEFEVEDGSYKYVEESLRKLRKMLNIFTEYSDVAQRPENYDPSSGYSLSQAFIDLTNERYPIPSEENIVNLTKSKRNQFVRSSIVRSPWLNSIATYIDILFNTTTINKEEILRASLLLENMTSPSTGDLSGLGIFIDLLENLILQLVRALGPSSATLDEMDMYSKTAVYKGRTSRNLIHISKTFQKAHDSNLQNNVGYEFFAGGLGPSSRQIGLRALSATQMFNRLTAEHRKYYGARAASEDRAVLATTTETATTGMGTYEKYINLEDTYYTFLTPSMVRVGRDLNKKILKEDASVWEPKVYLKMVMRILGSNPPSTSRQSSTPLTVGSGYVPDRGYVSKAVYSVGLMGKVSLANSSITLRHRPMPPIETPGAATVYDSDDIPTPYVRDDFLDPIDYMGEGTKFVTDPIEDLSLNREPLSEEQARNTAAINSTLAVSLTLGNELARPPIEQLAPTRSDNIIVISFSDEAEKEKYFKELPNQIKSLYLSNDTRTNKNWMLHKEETGQDIMNSPEYFGVFYTNFQHINKIEVLVGFTKDDSGEPQVSSPIYTSLNKDKFDTLKREGRIFLCRMVPHAGDTILNLKKNEKMRLPEYNKNFIIHADKISESFKRLQKREQRRLAAERLEAEGGRSAIIRELYIERLNEYPEVNSTGFEFMKRATGALKDIGGIPSEFIRTLVIEQPRIPTKVGTSFGKRSPRKKRRRSAAGTGPATTTTPSPTGTGDY